VSDLVSSTILLRCIIPYDVRLLFRPYAMQFGELREVGESFSSYNPGMGPRFSSLDKYNIDVAHIQTQRCSQYNNSCFDYEYMYDMQLYITNGDIYKNQSINIVY